MYGLGIDIRGFKKQEKTLVELSIEMNQRLELSKEFEVNQSLVPVENFSVLGIKNVGNSCYLNSVLQLLLTCPAFVDQKNIEEFHLKNCCYLPQNCLCCQIGILQRTLHIDDAVTIRRIVPYDLRRVLV